RVDVQADAGVARLAHAAPAAGDVEGDGYEVALLDELHAGTGLDDLAGDLMPENQALGGRRAAADHVLIRAADVRRDASQNRRVGQVATHVRRVDARPVLQLAGRAGDVGGP